jgi:hypothetical protein
MVAHALSNTLALGAGKQKSKLRGVNRRRDTLGMIRPIGIVGVNSSVVCVVLGYWLFV